ncbi:LPXTG cell wall anchor domain-containing protein [Baia soyae]|uniref:LPXTG-motif cell wall-anchored protein/predicted secreted protein with PEP-CTERM sorting signal n=1 Tax=Baia soyae TaxID=1544746 RepID=A0A4R2S0J4_9BACL|nr:LPXTG cell wall anchor domain-containing protein [Baia soyae]TCP65791.1 LPXTG-motif cell wall-anchored protein/predicted secreted protein with PEP-CTERM sorting signal [Baia soyae]
MKSMTKAFGVVATLALSITAFQGISFASDEGTVPEKTPQKTHSETTKHQDNGNITKENKPATKTETAQSKETKGGKLPKTATNYPIVVAASAAALMAGAGILLIRRRKQAQ